MNSYLADILKGEKNPETGETIFTDRALAEALGFNDLRILRQLMKRHADALAALGDLRSIMLHKSGSRGRKLRTTFLNLRHAVYLAQHCETPAGKTVALYLTHLGALVDEGKIATSNYDRSKVVEAQEKASAFAREYKDDWGTFRKIGYGAPVKPARLRGDKP